MLKLKYYFSFSYLKPIQYWPIRIVLILYFILIYAGLIYDLNTEKIEYYANTNEYLNLLFSDPTFYFIYIIPVFGVYFFSVVLEFFVTLDQNKNIKKRANSRRE
jgi:hypothetical protein